MPDPTTTAVPGAPPISQDPDAHGQAALLLAESMLHVLVETGVLSRAAAIDAVRTAAEVKQELADELGERRATLRRSLALLNRIEHSFGTVDGAP